MSQDDHLDTVTERANVSPRFASSERVAPLRGAAPAGVARRNWLFAAAVLLLLGAVAVAASTISASRDNARIDRLKTHGIAVTVTVSDCRGNLGGSGSNAVDYTCHGTYRVAGATYHEVIASMSRSRPSGTTVRGVVDPSQHSYVVLASALAGTSSSSTVFVVPALLASGLLVAAFVLVRLVRRRR